MIVADSHEFIELYRGDKDLRIGTEMVRLRSDLSFVSFGPDRLSPNDRDRFGAELVSEVGLPELPERMFVRLLPSISVRFSRKETGGIVSWMRGYGARLRELAPDVILENPFSWLTPRSYQTYWAARDMGVPVIYYDPGDDIPIDLKHRVMSTWERPVVNSAAAVITYNEAGKTRFMRKWGVPAERISVIPKPVDVARCRFGGDVTATRAEFGASPDDLVVAFLGRLTKYKGSRVLLEAARRALGDPRYEHVRFVFIGGALSSEESEEDYRLANTHVTGMVPHAEVPRMVAACDALVFPDVTHPGGFPTTVSEAMAAGRALVVGVGERTQFMPLVDGENALLVEPSSTEAILAAVCRLEDDRELAGAIARSVAEFAAREMDYPAVAARYLELIDSVLAHSGAPGSG